MTTQKRTILLIISGSIAAYKSLELIRLLRKEGHDVKVILTDGGAKFITPLSVAALSGHSVYNELFSSEEDGAMDHIRLSRQADMVAVVPASANLLAKMASGMADDLASTVLLASDKPVLVAPAMNTQMWKHPAVQRNLKQVQDDGVQVVMPVEGELACGEEGAGKMAELSVIAQEILG